MQQDKMETDDNKQMKLTNNDAQISNLISNEWKVKLVGSDGSFTTNGTRMALCSSLIRSMFVDSTANDVILLPDFTVETLEKLSSLIETGHVTGTQNELDGLHKLIYTLGITKERKFTVDVCTSQVSNQSESLQKRRNERKRSAAEEPVTFSSFRDLKIAKVTTESPEIITLSDDDDYDSEGEGSASSPFPLDDQVDDTEEDPVPTRLVLYRCSICEKTVRTKKEMHTHKRTHYKENALCKFCEVNFVNDTVLDKLNHVCKPTGSFPMFSCSLCDKKFCEESVMLVHFQQHSNNKNENLKCPKVKCSKMRQSVLKLLKHVRRHTKELSFIPNETFFAFTEHLKSNKENNGAAASTDSNLLSEKDSVPQAVSIPQAISVPQAISTPVLDAITNAPLRIIPASPSDELCCSLCTEDFATGQDKLDHVCSFESDDNTFSCDMCSKTFVEEHVMLVHQQQHNDITKVKCPFCNRKIPPVMHLLRHVKHHLEENKQNAPIGNKKIISSATPDNTESALSPKPSSRYSCNRCRFNADLETEIIAHLQQHQHIPSTLCPFCSKEFSNPVKKTAHVGSHLGHTSSVEGERICGLCNSIFNNDNDFLYHRNKQHKVPHECPMCSSAFDTIHELLGHMEGYKQEFERLSQCQFCTLKLNTLGEIIVHAAQHSRKTSLICPICSMKNPNEEVTMQHLDQHFVREEVKCGKCGMEFLEIANFKKHELNCGTSDSDAISRIKRAFSRPSPSPVEFISCNECNMNFCNTAKLYLHKQVHKNMSELSCPFCSVIFGNTTDAITHVEMELMLHRKQC